MENQQLLAFGVLASMMALFIWGKLRYDVVAILALLVAVAVGIVPAEEAFSGFSDDIVIIVGSALVVSGAVARSGIIETLLSRIAGRVRSTRLQISILVTAVALLSGFVKNVGALAMLMPAAFQMAKRSGSSASLFLMPMAFASLLGGLVTLVGTSPNIIVSKVREDMLGTPFAMFDYAPVGLGLTVAGIMFLTVAYRLLPNRSGTPTMGEAVNIKNYVTEARIDADSSADGIAVSAFVSALEGEVKITRIVRGETRPIVPLPDALLQGGDILLMEGDPDALERAIAHFGLDLEGQDRDAVANTASDEIGVIEAVVTPSSLLVGEAAGRLALHDRHRVNILAISRAGKRFTERLRDIILCPGDLIVLQGSLEELPNRLRDLGCLPLAARQLRLGSVRRGLVPLAILAVAMGLTATGVVPIALAFFGAAAMIMLSGALPPREAYHHVEWPILIMIGALIPVSDSLRTTGATDLIASGLSDLASGMPAWGAVALIMVAAMAVTPFLNNAATVLVMAPIGVTFAAALGHRPEAFLMAVAVGAGSDFLTPIGHQCNTLVMGPGGYRFTDYARLGAPLSLLVVLLGVPLIMAVWPLR